MKKLKLLPLAFVLALCGCQYIDIKDGKVPAQYLSAAKSLEGVYTGTMEGVPGQIEIKFDQDMPHVTYKDAAGNDIIRPGCNSTIGLLQGVLVDQDGNNGFVVKEADFGFNAGDCSGVVRGQQLALEFRNVSFTADGKGAVKVASKMDSKAQLFVSLLDHTEVQYHCYWQSGPSYPGHGYPGGYQVCEPYNVRYYRTGSFTKSN